MPLRIWYCTYLVGCVWHLRGPQEESVFVGNLQFRKYLWNVRFLSVGYSCFGFSL